MKVTLIVLDSVGIGQAPDADQYGDAGAYTLQHTAAATSGLNLPTLERLGLGNIPGVLPEGLGIDGVSAVNDPIASYGAMEEVSQGKDTITGHWEIAGINLNPGFHLFPNTRPSFPKELTHDFVEKTGRKVLGNRHSSGTQIIKELGQEASEKADYIIYTSADSVFQIAANIDIIPLEELYNACEIARELCNPYRVGRVIARPFTGEPGNYTRTKDRIDYAFNGDEETILERLVHHGIPVYSVGKIEDIFGHRGVTKGNHTSGNLDSQRAVEAFQKEVDHGFIFANYIDFDMLYGHQRDPQGYADCLVQTDAWLADFIPTLNEDDLLIITADHGNDPTFKGTDHTREYVPLLVYQKGQTAKNLGLRKGFYDIAQSIAKIFNVPPMPNGTSFL